MSVVQETGDLAATTEGQADQVLEAVAESMSDAVDQVNALPGDDRDLLDVYDDSGDAAGDRSIEMIGSERRRPAYRQLFANLRRK